MTNKADVILELSDDYDTILQKIETIKSESVSIDVSQFTSDPSNV